MFFRRLTVCLGVLATLGVAAPAAAQDAVAEGLARFAEADFSGALEAFARAEAGDDLSRADLVRLLAARANVHYALGDADAMRRALEQLAAVAPEHELGDESPPELHATLEEARSRVEPIRVRVEVTRRADAVRLEPVARGDTTGVVREVRLSWRTDGEWRRAGAEGVEVDGGARVAYYAEAIGPGGARVATLGSAAAPRHAGASSTAPDAGSGDDDTLLVALGVSGGAAVLMGIVVGVVVASTTSTVNPVQPPTWSR